MRKLLTFVAATLISGSILAGGLVTNTNQSAMFTRLQNRNASTGIDAVYFNPAGLTKLGDGFYASVNNQTIGQTKTVGNNYHVSDKTHHETLLEMSVLQSTRVYMLPTKKENWQFLVVSTLLAAVVEQLITPDYLHSKFQFQT